jgi:hypothetical protein
MQDEKLASAHDPEQWAAAQKAVDALKHEEDCRFCDNGFHPFKKDAPCPQCNGTRKKLSFFPALISTLKLPKMEDILGARTLLSRCKPGDWVAVRLANEVETKTHLGIYLGDFTAGLGAQLFKDGTLEITTSLGNPAMWVPDLKRIVRGYESWWGALKTPEDLKQITDADIENVWYVRALKELSEKEKAEASE